jgi:hypothetical protein
VEVRLSEEKKKKKESRKGLGSQKESERKEW